MALHTFSAHYTYGSVLLAGLMVSSDLVKRTPVARIDRLYGPLAGRRMCTNVLRQQKRQLHAPAAGRQRPLSQGTMASATAVMTEQPEIQAAGGPAFLSAEVICINCTTWSCPNACKPPLTAACSGHCSGCPRLRGDRVFEGHRQGHRPGTWSSRSKGTPHGPPFPQLACPHTGSWCMYSPGLPVNMPLLVMLYM